jgi:hypothetical protein
MNISYNRPHFNRSTIDRHLTTSPHTQDVIHTSNAMHSKRTAFSVNMASSLHSTSLSYVLQVALEPRDIVESTRRPYVPLSASACGAS